MATDAFSRLGYTLRHAHRYADLRRFLICVVFYQAGVQAVVALAAIYAQQAMGFTTSDTLLLVLVVNVTAAIGAFFFGHVQDRLGHVRTIVVTLIGWLITVVVAWAARDAALFWLAANLAGLCLGSSQSAGRALVGYLSPPDRHAEFFGLWSLAVKLSSILGPVTYGAVTWISGGDHRMAILITGAYFVIGITIIAGVDAARGRRAARASKARCDSNPTRCDSDGAFWLQSRQARGGPRHSGRPFLIGWFGRGKPENAAGDTNAKLQTLVANLPMSESADALLEIGKQLQQMHGDSSLKLDQRFRNLDLLDGASRQHERALLLEYLATPRHKKSHETKLWSSAYNFWRELGEGYQQCFREAQKSGAAAKSSLPIFGGRALRALRQQLRWTLLRYEAAEARVWSDMAKLYLYAEQNGCATEQIAVYPGSSGSGTPKQEYLKALMLAASSTDSLQPGSQDLVTRLVAHFSGFFVISDKPESGCTHWIDLDAAAAPVRVVRAPPAKPGIRYIGAGAGLHEIEQLRAHIAYTRTLPEGLDLNGNYGDEVVVALLKHLEQDWAGKTQSRRHERRKVAGRVTVVPGLKELIESLEFAYNDSLDFTHQHAAESWIVEDMSEKGYGAVIPSVAGDWVEVGSLIGVEGDSFREWRVGVIRRVTRSEQQRQRVGVELLARESSLVKLRRPSGSAAAKAVAPRPAVLFATQLDGNKQVDIALAKDVFEPDENIEMLAGETVYLLHPKQTVERGPHYEVVQYSILRAVH